MDASDLFSAPGGFSPPLEARLQKGFVVRLVSGVASSVLEPAQSYDVLPDECNIFKAALMRKLKWIASDNKPTENYEIHSIVLVFLPKKLSSTLFSIAAGFSCFNSLYTSRCVLNVGHTKLATSW